MTRAQDWKALATEVRKRREKLRLPIDLANHGGPTEMTVRKIESGESVSIRPRTKVLLERALQWRDGLVDDILNGTATEEDLRRFWSGPQDAAGTPIVRFSFVGPQPVHVHRPPPDNDNVTVVPGDTLDVAGRLSGDVDDAWIVQHSDQARRWPKAQWDYVGAHRVSPMPESGAASAPLGWLTATARGQAHPPIVTTEAPITPVPVHERAGWQRIERRPAMRAENEPVDFDEWRKANMPEQGVALRHLFDGEHTAELEAFRNQISTAMRPFTEAASSHLANMMSGLAPTIAQLMPAPTALLGIQAALDNLRPLHAEITSLASIVEEQGAVFRALREIAPQPVDLTPILPPMGDSLRALAIPPLRLSPELVEAFKFYSEHEEEIESRPWFPEDGDIRIVDAVRRYRAEIEAPTTEEPAEPEQSAEREVFEGEVILGPWGVVLTQQQNVGDLDDLALASELFARLARRPRTAERDHQLEALRGLVNELADERRALEAGRGERNRLPRARRQLGS